jgi:hypothetical protein
MTAMNKNLRHKVGPVEPGTFADNDPEFVRVGDVQKRAGIKRGICYRRIADGTFKSVLLREPGNRQGCRLVYWPSVKAYLHGLMAQQMEEAQNADKGGTQ